MNNIKNRLILCIALFRFLFMDIKSIITLRSEVFKDGSEITFTHKAKFTKKGNE